MRREEGGQPGMPFISPPRISMPGVSGIGGCTGGAFTGWAGGALFLPVSGPVDGVGVWIDGGAGNVMPGMAWPSCIGVSCADARPQAISAAPAVRAVVLHTWLALRSTSDP